mmetsp:Transcript_13615/g.18851  ORF Transcript_13615/g.18851 Transcript_13615/m.18851 type:complete len:95 (-) Transcript_13615:110-394(-)
MPTGVIPLRREGSMRSKNALTDTSSALKAIDSRKSVCNVKGNLGDSCEGIKRVSKCKRDEDPQTRRSQTKKRKVMSSDKFDRYLKITLIDRIRP